MSEQTAQEPTMEEILASIRRIISEDDAPASAAPAEEAPLEEPAEPVAALAPEPEPEPLPEPEVEAALEPEPEPLEAQDEEVLELTERVETVGDLDVFALDAAEEPAVAAAPEPVAELPVEPPPPTEPLVSEVAASAAASAFGKLSAAVAMPADGQTLDGVVRELLRPLLKDWLDTNLAGIVQAAVAEEVDRISRTRR